MTVSRELSLENEKSSLQRRESRSFISKANYIEFSGVKVVTPTGNVLVDDLTLRVESGSNLLITGSHLNSLLCGPFLFHFLVESAHPWYQAENIEKNKRIYKRIESFAKKYECTTPQLALAWYSNKAMMLCLFLLRVVEEKRQEVEARARELGKQVKLLVRKWKEIVDEWVRLNQPGGTAFFMGKTKPQLKYFGTFFLVKKLEIQVFDDNCWHCIYICNRWGLSTAENHPKRA
ncbi:hypothetical protein S83_016471 [Arachis hypogaea]